MRPQLCEVDACARPFAQCLEETGGFQSPTMLCDLQLLPGVADAYHAGHMRFKRSCASGIDRSYLQVRCIRCYAGFQNWSEVFCRKDSLAILASRVTIAFQTCLTVLVVETQGWLALGTKT